MSGLDTITGGADMSRLTEARIARDEALKRVSDGSPDFLSEALDLISSLKKWTGTGEQLRFFLVASGLKPPHHHNAWGALIRAAVIYGYLIDTGEVDYMMSKKSHGRRTPIYRTR